MIDPVIGTMITAGGNIGSNLMNNFFAHTEAKKQRKWSEEMYNKYYSPMAQRMQQRAAGISPLANDMLQPLASPSGASASPSSSTMPDFGATIINKQLAKANVNATNADALGKMADAVDKIRDLDVKDNPENGGLFTDSSGTYFTIRSARHHAELSHLISDRDVKDADIALKDMQSKLSDKQREQIAELISGIKSENQIKEVQAKIAHDFNITPNDDGIKALCLIALKNPEKFKDIASALVQGAQSAVNGVIQGSVDNLLKNPDNFMKMLKHWFGIAKETDLFKHFNK